MKSENFSYTKVNVKWKSYVTISLIIFCSVIYISMSAIEPPYPNLSSECFWQLNVLYSQWHVCEMLNSRWQYYYLPPADRPGTGDYKMPDVRPCVRPCVRPSVRSSRFIKGFITPLFMNINSSNLHKRFMSTKACLC